MKKLKAILSIALAGILLGSSAGFSVSRHYCMGMLMNESFYTITDGCGMEVDDACEKASETVHEGCCENQNLAFTGIDVISIVKKQIDLVPANVAVLPVTSVVPHLQTTNYEQLSFFPPPEPLPYGRNLLVQVQRFLI